MFINYTLYGNKKKIFKQRNIPKPGKKFKCSLDFKIIIVKFLIIISNTSVN